MNQTVDRNQDATVYVGNLDERCTEALIWELMLQAGPVVNVHLPKDRVSQNHQGYGFCEFLTEEDADYCIKILNMVKLFGKPIRVNKATSDNKKSLDVGANLFVGNLSLEVDEKMLYETFVQFGSITQTPTIARDPANGNPKGYGFVSYDSFEAADSAVDAMNGQFLANKALIVSFAFKKDGKGERHGSAAERLLAAQAKVNNPDAGRTIHDLRPNEISTNMPMLPPPPSQLNAPYGQPNPGMVSMQPPVPGMQFQQPPPGFMPPPAGFAPPPPGPYYPQYPPSNFY